MVVSMTAQSQEIYQGASALERAVVDLVRVGSSGHAAGVRQLASRLSRSVPDTVADADGFRRELHEATTRSTPSTGLRFAGGEVPTDDGGHHRLVDVDPFPDGSGLIWPASTFAELTEIVEEREHAVVLARAGLGLTRTVLLSGPPGVGKTMAAAWLAQHVGLPLVTLDLAAVISSYLGSSGRNIRAVLDYGRSGPCVMLLDEFDALAKRRDDDTDIGELKRIVNVILTELDRWPDTSLLVAATNHDQLLDPAVHRRFDVHIVVPMPSLAERHQILGSLAGATSSDDELGVIALAAALTEGYSGSDLVRLWQRAARKAVLGGTAIGVQLLQRLAWRKIPAGPDRDALWQILADVGGMSAREIACRTGLTHPTVSAGIKRGRARS